MRMRGRPGAAAAHEGLPGHARGAHAPQAIRPGGDRGAVNIRKLVSGFLWLLWQEQTTLFMKNHTSMFKQNREPRRRRLATSVTQRCIHETRAPLLLCVANQIICDMSWDIRFKATSSCEAVQVRSLTSAGTHGRGTYHRKSSVAGASVARKEIHLLQGRRRWRWWFGSPLTGTLPRQRNPRGVHRGGRGITGMSSYAQPRSFFFLRKLSCADGARGGGRSARTATLLILRIVRCFNSSTTHISSISVPRQQRSQGRSHGAHLYPELQQVHPNWRCEHHQHQQELRVPLERLGDAGGEPRQRRAQA